RLGAATRRTTTSRSPGAAGRPSIRVSCPQGASGVQFPERSTASTPRSSTLQLNRQGRPHAPVLAQALAVRGRAAGHGGQGSIGGAASPTSVMSHRPTVERGGLGDTPVGGCRPLPLSVVIPVAAGPSGANPAATWLRGGDRATGWRGTCFRLP